ncbi:hypothetical protein QAD02_015886 [Eretmocerus hayati]|uniref:Uncharacterized protein n=1 Tax=Eretmocerus hayati TaxID=131215 RepID=A0ACC2P9X1_9HYME|nr:hypothetical protein QAD02_015886 [Eretmocerus hayati]
MANNLKILLIIIHLLWFVLIASALDPPELVIIILSQEQGYSAAQAKLLKSNVIEQANSLERDPPQIFLSHELDVYGAWTIVPIFAYLGTGNISATWYFFCLENTAIRLGNLLKVLDKYDVNIYKNLWIGHALYDHEPTIIHHYAEHRKKFKYPNVASGFAVSKFLFKSLAERANEVITANFDFSIDASYEFSTFVLNQSKGSRLTHVSEFCVVSNKNCATYPKPFYSCGETPVKQNAFVAVKTCSKYHLERLDVIRQTWAKHAENIGFFTDELDENLVDGHVVPKTDEGHCAKTYAILKNVHPILERDQLDWLIITDDDTIMSLGRLFKMLTCYNPKDAVALGERYGYRITKIHGYDYLTGGSGVVLSKKLVEQMIKPGVCECPSATTPDDMFLFGVCLAHLGVKVTHSAAFHQARPNDYPKALLASQDPVSFHKFWMVDPKNVYKQWFYEEDLQTFPPKKFRRHTEL